MVLVGILASIQLLIFPVTNFQKALKRFSAVIVVVFLAGAARNFMSETAAFCANKPDGRDGGRRRH